MVTLGPVQPSLLPLPRLKLGESHSRAALWSQTSSCVASSPLQGLRGLRGCPGARTASQAPQHLGAGTASPVVSETSVWRKEETASEYLVCALTSRIKKFTVPPLHPQPHFLQRDVQGWSKYVSLSLNIDLVFFSDLLLKGFLSQRLYSLIIYIQGQVLLPLFFPTFFLNPVCFGVCSTYFGSVCGSEFHVLNVFLRKKVPSLYFVTTTC